MLEIGINYGCSIKMWRDYFMTANIIGLDLFQQGDFVKNPDLIQEVLDSIGTDNFDYVIGDQSDKEVLKKVVSKIDNKFQFIIDDGSHVAKHQQLSMGFLFKYLNYDGFYIMEDLHTRRKHQTRRTIDVLKDFDKTGEFKSDVLSDETNEYITKTICSTYYYKNKTCIIRKQRDSAWLFNN